MLRAIREVQPRWIVGENVRGLVNWNGGMVFDEVQVDLENEGYEVQPFILPACGVNAPHRRDRVWFIAYNNQNRCTEFSKQTGDRDDREERVGVHVRPEEGRDEVRGINSGGGTDESTPNSRYTKSQGPEQSKADNQRGSNKGQQEGNKSSSRTRNGNVANANSFRGGYKNDRKRQRTKISFKDSEANIWQDFPTQHPLCGGNDGIPGELDGITFPKWRNESIKAYGNAVVPQVVLQIFKAIKQYENQT